MRHYFEGCLAEIFLAVGSHQHRGRNPDGRNCDLSSQRKLKAPTWALCLLRREGLTPGMPLDLAVRHREECSSISCSLNKDLKNYVYFLLTYEDLCLQKV